MKAWFLTGTDTGIGKTTAVCALLKAAERRGLSTLGLKPLASGCESTPDGLRNSDALLLGEAATLKLPYSEINPVALPYPLSPHLAAAAVGKRIGNWQLGGYVRAALSHRPDFAVVEGAGGWRVPLSDREMLSGLAKELRLPVILVVGLRLGCLNHAFLTVESILRDGVKLAGWIGNRIDPAMAAVDDNVATLSHWLPAPCLGILPHAPGQSPAALAEHLDLTPLLG